MKIRYCPIFLVFVMSMSFPIKALGLSCIGPIPVVGVVESIKQTEAGLLVALSNTSAFDTSSFTETESINVEHYHRVVENFIKNKTLLSTKAGEVGERASEVKLPSELLAANAIREGDVIVIGPPVHVCSLGFAGVFSDDGELRAVVVKDAFNSYKFREAELVVRKGSATKCEKTKGRCKIKVEFALGETRYVLRPGQLRSVSFSPIEKIHLIDSSDHYRPSGKPSVFDWGFGTFAHYLIVFKSEEAKN